MSNLLKKVENTNRTASSSTETAEEEAVRLKSERDAKLKEKLDAANAKANSEELKENAPKKKKKDDRHIHWADSKGQALAMSEGETVESAAAEVKKKGPEKTRKSRWAERKKKDIEHEKELLLQSRQVVSSLIP